MDVYCVMLNVSLHQLAKQNNILFSRAKLLNLLIHLRVSTSRISFLCSGRLERSPWYLGLFRPVASGPCPGPPGDWAPSPPSSPCSPPPSSRRATRCWWRQCCYLPYPELLLLPIGRRCRSNLRLHCSIAGWED